MDKKFEDMGIIKMAKTLGEMGDDMRKEYHHTATDCVQAEDQYEKEIRRLRCALEASDIFLSDLYRTMDKDDFYRDRLIETCKVVRQAIARAEGRS